MKTINPATGQLIQEYEPHAAREVDARITAAQETFLSWSMLRVEERTEKLLSVAALLEEQEQAFARLMSAEMGKPLKESLGEVRKCAWLIRALHTHAPAWLSDQPIRGADGQRNYVRYEPLGPVYIIMPWNFPFWQVFKVAIPPIVAGNTILLKHASNVTGSALAIHEVFKQAGLDGVLQTLLVTHQTSDSIIADNRIAAVSVTGSEHTGAHVAGLAARHIKKSVLELGGSDPFIVCEDADVVAAARGAVAGRFLNAGQVCIGAKRFLVHASVAYAFTEAFVHATVQLKIGDPLQEDTDMGPLVNESAVRDMEGFVEDARNRDAEVVLGGARMDRPGYFFEPTVLCQVTPEMRVMREETFGPIAPIMAFEREEEAIQVANDSRFGLNASVWTQDLRRGERLAGQLRAGGVFINKPSASHPLIPLGGIKRSGYGRELGEIGIREFANPKPINVYRAE